METKKKRPDQPKKKNKLESLQNQQIKINNQIRKEKFKEKQREEKQSYAFLKKTKLPKVIFINLEIFKLNDETTKKIVEVINTAANQIEEIIEKINNETQFEVVEKIETET